MGGGGKGEEYFILFSTPENKIFCIIQKRAYLLKAEICFVLFVITLFWATFKGGAYILIWTGTLTNNTWGVRMLLINCESELCWEIALLP